MQVVAGKDALDDIGDGYGVAVTWKVIPVYVISRTPISRTLVIGKIISYIFIGRDVGI